MFQERFEIGGWGMDWVVSDQCLNILRILETPPTTPIPHFWKKAGSAHMFAITIVLLHGRHISIIMSIYK